MINLEQVGKSQTQLYEMHNMTDMHIQGMYNQPHKSLRDRNVTVAARQIFGEANSVTHLKTFLILTNN